MDEQGNGIVTARHRFDFRGWRKAAGIGAAGVGLSLLLATGALAAPPSATRGAATPGTATPAAAPANGTPVAPGRGGKAARPVGSPAGDGTVTAISGGTITVQGGGPAGGGTTKTIAVTGGTAYFTGGPGTLKAGSLADVKVGSHVHAEGTVDSGGNLTALVVRVEAPAASGEVTAVAGNAITVQDKGPASNGATKTITVSGGTAYYIGGPDSATKGSLADVKAGVRIHAEGTLNGDGSFSATTVRIDQPSSGTGAPPAPGKGGPHGGGEVTAVSGSTITVQDKGPTGNGGTRTITVTGGTIYLVGAPGSVTKGSLGDVKAGVHVHAEGTVDGSGNLTALLVRIDQPPAQP